MKTFEQFPHTADVGIKVWGDTLPLFFEHAAEGMFSFLQLSGEGEKSLSQTVQVTGIDAESLLVNWLNELLYISGERRIAPVRFTVERISSRELCATVQGSVLKAGTHALREIKAATYSSLAIRHTDEGFYTEIVFDV